MALIGHSRGAHFAKALAHRRPERVAGVISLGAGLDTPFDISLPTKAAVAAARGGAGAAPRGGLLHRALRLRVRARLRAAPSRTGSR